MNNQQWQVVERLFLEAADLPEADRERFLISACQGDAEVRERVLAMLRNDNEDGDFLTSAIRQAAASLVGAETPDYTGACVSRYRILGPLGRGGMGTVWVARREGADFEQKVAIKFLSSLPFGPNEGFRRERRILAQLNHPNIALFLDGDTAPDGTPFTVLELVEGQPITSYCGELRLSLAGRLGLFLQVCSAVEYIHGQGVVHRDLKPNNILVTPAGVPKLLDFGIAQTVREPASSHGRGGAVFGTAHYLSPEQAQGRDVDQRSDIFSLGIVLYEMLSGNKPFDGASSTEVVAAVMGSAPPRLSLPGRARPLEGILERMLRKAPEERYGEVKAVIAALRPVLRRMEAPPAVGRKFGAAAAVLAVGLAAGWWQWKRSAGPLTGEVKVVRLTNVGEVVAANASPDGEWLVFMDQRHSLRVQRIGEQSSRQVLQLGVGLWGLTLSPDRQWIYYTTPDASIYRVRMAGGLPERLPGTSNGGPELSPDGKRMLEIRYSATQGNRVVLAAPDGTNERIVAKLNAEDGFYSPVIWTRDSRSLLAGKMDAHRGVWELWTIDPESGAARRWMDRTFGRMLTMALLPGGDLLVNADERPRERHQIWLVRGNRMQSLAADSADYRMVAPTAAGVVAMRVAVSSNISAGPSQGPLHAVTEGSSEYVDLSWLRDRGGSDWLLAAIRSDTVHNLVLLPIGQGEGEAHTRWLFHTADRISSVAACPDGRTILFDRASEDAGGIWKMDTGGSAPVRLTNGKYDTMPRCSPDSTWMTFVSGNPSRRSVSRASLLGGAAVPLTAAEAEPAAISPDGQWILVGRKRDDGSIAYLAARSTGGGERSLEGPFYGTPDWSGDGKSLLFQGLVGGRYELMSRPLDGGPAHQVTRLGSAEYSRFAISPDGKEVATLSWRRESEVVLLQGNWKHP